MYVLGLIPVSSTLCVIVGISTKVLARPIIIHTYICPAHTPNTMLQHVVGHCETWHLLLQQRPACSNPIVSTLTVDRYAAYIISDRGKREACYIHDQLHQSDTENWGPGLREISLGSDMSGTPWLYLASHY